MPSQCIIVCISLTASAVFNRIGAAQQEEPIMVVATQTTQATLPPLESGDRLTRAEFEARYAAMPEVKKAELVEVVVYLASPVRVKSHGQPHSSLNTWVGVYMTLTPGIMACDNTTVRLDSNNEPQPNILLRIEESRGGQSHISEDDYIEGAPELVVEIAGSRAAYDLHNKKQAYLRNGVQEYIVWDSGERSLSWCVLRSQEYVTLDPDESGIIRSQVFPGLWLNVDAFVADDLAAVYQTLQSGIADEAHQQFVRKLEPSR